MRNCYCGGYWREIARGGEQSSGYSFKKGIAGSVLFGSVGAVAGIGGKKTHHVTYQCSKCGRTKVITYDSKGNVVSGDY